MRFKWIDDLGDWNPQLLRELKGHLKPRNVLIAGVISLLGQFLFFMGFRSQLPLATAPALEGASVLYNKYCIGDRFEYGLPKCLTNSVGNPVIHWQLWWLDLFNWLSLIGIFVLLVAGTYLLISDLAHEEQRDTLNFIRLSPQSPQSILVGKLLGVPILLYMVAGLAVPLHLWAGLAAQISLSLILSFYAVLLASCLFCYSAALLFSLVSSWLGGFQAWLASGTVLIFLWSACLKPIMHIPGDWLNLFSPSLLLPYLIAATGIKDYGFPLSDLEMDTLEWFYLPLGASTVVVIGFALLNYGLWTYWSWQALTRRFPNPSKTIFSKQQSYLLVACFEVLIIGFAATTPKWPTSTELSVNFQFLLVYNLLLFLGLIVTLTPQRQALQDWARYRRERGSSHKSFWSRSLVQDLVWGEKSPALIAIALNLAIAAAMLVPWIGFVLQDIDKLPAFFSLVIGLNLILICGAIAQMILSMRTQKQAIWVTGTVSAVILLPPVMLSLLSLYPHKTPALWLFTPFAWASIEQVSATTVFLALLGQWSILTLCTLQITRQLRQSGESASKALFAGNPSLPSS